MSVASSKVCRKINESLTETFAGASSGLRAKQVDLPDSGAGAGFF